MTARTLLAAALVIAALVLLTVPSGGFGVVDEVRDARVGVAATDRAVVGVEPADTVPIRCAGPLVAVRNNAAESATVTVRLTDAGGGSLLSPGGADRGTEYVFELAPGGDRTVSIAGVRSGVDAVGLTVTTEMDGGVVVTTDERVPTDGVGGGDGDGDDDDDDEDDPGEGDDEDDGNACPTS